MGRLAQSPIKQFVSKCLVAVRARMMSTHWNGFQDRRYSKLRIEIPVACPDLAKSQEAAPLDGTTPLGREPRDDFTRATREETALLESSWAIRDGQLPYPQR